MLTESKPYKEFMERMIPLAINFAYMWKITHPMEEIRKILNQRTNLIELLQLNKTEQQSLVDWSNFLDKAKSYFSEGVSKEYFEKELTCMLTPLALSRFNQYYEWRVNLFEKYNAGSLKYDAPLSELPRNYCNFHIANMVSPKSFFEDPEYLPRCFMELMDKSEKEYGYDTLCTFTWLNSRSRWLALFPQEWHDNMSEPDNQITGNLGYWGQLITAGGTVNIRMEEYVRTHGELKYKPCKSHCSFKAMRRHLNKYLSEVA
jgi:hypothetical protein